jgi:hypothetical protein
LVSIYRKGAGRITIHRISFSGKSGREGTGKAGAADNDCGGFHRMAARGGTRQEFSTIFTVLWISGKRKADGGKARKRAAEKAYEFEKNLLKRFAKRKNKK